MQRTINYKNILFVLLYLTSVLSLKTNNTKLQKTNNNTSNTIYITQNQNNAENQLRYDVPDDCRFKIVTDKEISLICNLRSINSEYDTTNFSVIPSDNTVELNIFCNDDIMIKSYLDAKSFIHLIRLKTLTIKYCKLSKLYPDILTGLNNLKNLTIQTHNNNWNDFNLDLDNDSFNFTRNLERLDLSKNNIWTLPQNVFCLINSLSYLNVSENHLHDINELGFRDKTKDDTTNTTLLTTCSLDLQILDMSFNNFVLLPANGFGILKRLNQLKLNNNEISMIADKALSGLKNLQIINLNSNKIVALPSELFVECSATVKEVYLQNNSITIISPKLFTNLEQLQALDLSYNQITSTWIDKNTFLGLIRLVLLDLSHNKITKLMSDYFLDLYTLQILNLRHNQLDNIESNTFSLMNNLHTLLLSYNNIKYLDGFALNGLYVLSLLSIDNNQLYDIHPDAFRNCSSLQDVNLNGNKLTTVPTVLRNMRLLRTIDLGENQLTTINSSAFNGLHNLYGLRLIGNNLQNITVNMFDGLVSLQILNLAHNKINFIELNTFASTPSIQAIRLDGNQINDIGELFIQIPNLLWLNISDNKLEKFDYSQIPKSLQWLDLHKNILIELSNINPIKTNNQLRLQTLDVSFNLIEKLTPQSIPNSIELLFLNDNKIKIVEPNVFLEKTNLTRVDLYANQLRTLDVKSFRILPVSYDKLLPEFYIGGNPFVCDCNIEWLQKINLLTSHHYPKVMDLDTIYCTLLNSREQTFVSLVNAQSKHFLCSYKTHCFALCHCCDFDACDCEMTCPNNCTCFHDESWSTNIVECSTAGYNEIPNNIPMDTTELYLDGNDLIELSGHSFIGRKNLLVLFANNSNIQNIYNTTFSGLKRLLQLHLEQNQITRLYGNEFNNNLENLKELFLQNNKINYIANGTFMKLEKLEILRLDGNKLIQFEIWQLTHNIYLREIGLSGNVWSCECSYLSRFRNYLQINSDKIIDANLVACIYNNMSSILKEKNGTKCTLREGISTYVRASKIENLLPLLLIGTCTFIGFFGFILGIFCYRQELSTLAQTNCLFKLCFKSTTYMENCNKDRFYDAYIAYSLQDETFVNQILADTLENDIGYKLSLHYRDLNLNLYITDAIIEAVDNSKQAILVLSKNFLYNEWSRFEYKSALHEIMNKRIKLIFILYGDLPQRDIDIDMRHYLKINTCIEWNDKKFWQKLRLALPTPGIRSCVKAHSNLNIYGASNDYTLERGALTKHYDCSGGGGGGVGNYPRKSSCSKNYRNNFDTTINNCKYNTVNNKNVLRINTIEKTHEYAVPLNYRIAEASTYTVSLDKKTDYPDGCGFYLMSKYSTIPDSNTRQIKLTDNNQGLGDSATSVCNLSVNGSTSSGSINTDDVNAVSCNNVSHIDNSKCSNDSKESKTNKIMETLWS